MTPRAEARDVQPGGYARRRGRVMMQGFSEF